MSAITEQNTASRAEVLSVAAEAPAGVPLVTTRPRARVSDLAGRALFGTFLLVLLMSPFEAGYPPLGRFLWATYTNLEATIFLMAAAWAITMLVDPQARLRFIRTP